MRTRPIVPASCLSVLFLLASIPAFGQSKSSTSTTSVERDAQAVSAAQAALTAMGGASAISQVQNVVVSGTSIDQAGDQSTASSFTWTQAGAEFCYQTTSANGGHTLVSNGGYPQDFHAGAWILVPPVVVRTSLPYHVPALVLFNELANPGYAFILVGSTTINGKNAIHVLTRDDSDATGHSFTPQDWYFDASTGLPLHVSYQVPLSQNASDSLQESIDFAGYQAVSGIHVPFQLTITEGQSSFVTTVSSAAFNTSLGPSVFSPSEAQQQ